MKGLQLGYAGATETEAKVLEVVKAGQGLQVVEAGLAEIEIDGLEVVETGEKLDVLQPPGCERQVLRITG